jgi:hypothetical protein
MVEHVASRSRRGSGILMKRNLTLLGTLATVAFVILVIVFWADSATWFMKYTGSVNSSSSSWYGFWSGFGGSIPDFLILGSIITVYRHHNCHVKGCIRLGKPVEGTPYLACPVHHPAHQGDKRSVSADVINLAHRAHMDLEARKAAPQS